MSINNIVIRWAELREDGIIVWNVSKPKETKMTTIEKILSDEATFIEKKRTRALAMGNWTTVIECEAKLELIRAVKSKLPVETTLGELLEKQQNRGGSV